ncbi:phage portal protein [Streptomyces goshikiensis]|uniref:phage portal protein n=1 Tax=Streptomyces goshikiensis TaxID=1942 RepID=UPI003722CEA0
MDEVYSSPQVARMLAKFGLHDLEVFNFSHIPVDVVADKLHLNQVTTEDESIDLLLDELRDYNDLDEEFPILLRNTCKFGDAYLFVWPVADENGTVTNVKMRCKDPLTTRLFYSDEDPMVKSFAIQSWEEGAKATLTVRANLYYADRVERYEHKGKVPQDPKRAKWALYEADGLPGIMPHDFGQVPFFHYRTTRQYGTPEHLNAYGPQSGINKLITSHLATVDYQSFPQRYALTDPTADRSGSQGNDWDEEHPEDGGDPERAVQSQLDSSPAAMWDLSGYKSVGQFQAADPDAFMKPLDRYIKAMAQVTQIPMHAFDDRAGDAMTGASRREANETLYDRVESRQRTFGATHKRAFEFALFLYDEEADVSVKWKPVRKIEDSDAIPLIQMKRDLGVPDDVLLAEIGYDSADIDTWMSERSADIPAEPIDVKGPAVAE